MRTLSLPALAAAMMFSCAAQGGPLIADLSAVPASASIHGAWFVSDHPLPTGTGNISSFVRIGANTDIIQGYNTDYRPVEFDELTSANFTRSLLLSEVPVVRLSDGRRRAPSKTLVGGTHCMLWLKPVEQIQRFIARELAALPDRRRIVLTTAGVAPPACPMEKFQAIGHWLAESTGDHGLPDGRWFGDR